MIAISDLRLRIADGIPLPSREGLGEGCLRSGFDDSICIVVPTSKTPPLTPPRGTGEGDYALRPPHSAFRISAFTLIELLIAIAIIATLSALFLGASRSAMESSRAARTKTTIAKLHTLIMEQWASYETRRIDIAGPIQTPINDMLKNNAIDQKAHSAMTADVRLLGVRELVKFEMPDRWSDVIAVNSSSPEDSQWRAPEILAAFPTIGKIYHRRFVQAARGSDKNPAELNGSAECLYLTVMLMTGDGEARTMFTAMDIGDTDEDGVPEFLDGWGNPIRWIRWPAGFINRSFVMTPDDMNAATGDPLSDHDPFDPFLRNSRTALPEYTVHPSSTRGFVQHLRGVATNSPSGGFNIGYRLVPLIFSMGPDGIGDMSTREGDIADPADIALDPYVWDTTYDTYEFGSYGDNPAEPDGDDNSIDNIHNHLQDNR